MASHDFDMARFLVGSEIEEVSDIISLPGLQNDHSPIPLQDTSSIGFVQGHAG